MFPYYKQVSGYASTYGDDSLGYDFTFIQDNKKHYVEVKSFIHKKIYLTSNEINTAKKYKEKYHIYLVSQNHILDIGNPFMSTPYKIKVKV